MRGEIVAEQDRQKIRGDESEGDGRQDGRGEQDRKQHERSPGRRALVGESRQDRRERAQKGDDGEAKSPNPGSAPVRRRRIGAAKSRIQPVARRLDSLFAVDNSDMFGAGGIDVTPRVALGEIAVGFALPGFASRHFGDDSPGGVAQERGLPGAVYDDQVARIVRGDRAAEQRQRHDGVHALVLHRILDDEFRGHGMADERHPSVALRERAGEGDDRADVLQQPPGARLQRLQAAQQRRGIAAVAGEVEGDDHIAAAAEGRSERLHHLLRARETVGDDDDRGVDDVAPSVNRRGNAFDISSFYDETPRGAMQRGQAPRHRDQRQQQRRCGENPQFLLRRTDDDQVRGRLSDCI